MGAYSGRDNKPGNMNSKEFSSSVPTEGIPQIQGCSGWA